MSLEAVAESAQLGRGRSGIVFLDASPDGTAIARKVFIDGLAARVVNYFFSGAPAAYGWNEDAITSAYYSREIVSNLVEYWFGDRLKVAKARGFRWNEKHRAYELETEFIDGRHASLHHPFSQQNENELSDLVNNIMKPLQERLIESGFDGLVWQAGKGNPVAPNNFMLEKSPNENRWAWIDLESGVPAMFPLNPLSYLFYLRKSLKHRRALFDDVDIEKLAKYVLDHQAELTNALGTGRVQKLFDNLYGLSVAQLNWKSRKRVDRSIEHSLKKGKISESQSEFYSRHHGLWYGREGARIAGESAVKLLADLPFAALDKLSLSLYQFMNSSPWKLVLSQRHRTEMIREFVGDRISSWEKRKQLSQEEAAYLRRQLDHESTTAYLTDLGFNFAIKIFEPALVGSVAASLYANGAVDLQTSLAIVLLGGSVTRTAYTGGRIILDTIKSGTFKSIPQNVSRRAVALVIGTIPTYGNAAYPAQMVYSGSTESRNLGKFLLYDLHSEIGSKVPIWGGKDTGTEHFFNRIPSVLLRNRKPLPSNYAG